MGSGILPRGWHPVDFTIEYIWLLPLWGDFQLEDGGWIFHMLI